MANSETMNSKPNLKKSRSSSASCETRSEGNMANIDKAPTFSKTAKSVFGSMRKRAVGSYQVAGVAASMLFASNAAFGLGLGVLDVQSNLDQPLSGLITVNVAPGDDLSSLQAQLASREEFETLGVDYPDYLKDIKLTVERSGGGAVLRVSSNNVVIKEPFIHFLVKVTWSGGNFLREYTALIDPPVYAAETPRSISRPRAVGEDVSVGDSAADTQDDIGSTIDDAPITSETIDSPAVEVDDVVSSTADQNEEFDGAEARYGPVRSGESLSLIAQDLQRQVPDLSIYAIMQALFEENPNAFIDNNINGLIQGSILDIRDLDQIRNADLEAARQFFQQQIADWDPSVLASGSESGIGVGQDTYTSDADLFGADSSADTAVADNFQVGASTDTDTFVSSAQGQGDQGEVLALRQEITQLQSSLASSEAENQELTERIAILEGQLTDMNRLMSLSVENAELADLENTLAQQNEAVDAVTEAADAASNELNEFLGEDTETVEDLAAAGNDLVDDAVTSTDDLLDEFLTDDTESPAATDEFGFDEIVDDAADELGLNADEGEIGLVDETQSVLEEVVEEDAPVNVAPVTPVVETPSTAQSLLDKVGGLVPVLGGVGALLLGGLGLFFWRRRRADEEFEISMLSIESNSQSVDIDTESGMSASMSASVTASMMSGGSSENTGEPDKETSFLTVYSDSDAVVQADEVDPIAEADVYIAYGRDEQAEEVLLDGIAAHPNRVDVKQKLIGLYFKNKNTEGFERIAEELYAQRDSMSGQDWQEISDMGAELVPENPLFALSGVDFDSVERASENVEAEAAEEEDSLSFDSASDEKEAAADESELSEMVVDSLNEDESIQLINFDDGRSEISELDEVEIDAIASDEDDVLSFDSGDSAVAATASQAVSSAADAIEDDDLVLDFESDAADDDEKEFGEERKVSEVPEVSDLVIDPEYDEAETQYELAKVFVDLGDEDGARKILDDIVANNENSDELIAKSQELLDSMNG